MNNPWEEIKRDPVTIWRLYNPPAIPDLPERPAGAILQALTRLEKRKPYAKATLPLDGSRPPRRIHVQTPLEHLVKQQIRGRKR